MDWPISKKTLPLSFSGCYSVVKSNKSQTCTCIIGKYLTSFYNVQNYIQEQDRTVCTPSPRSLLGRQAQPSKLTNFLEHVSCYAWHSYCLQNTPHHSVPTDASLEPTALRDWAPDKMPCIHCLSCMLLPSWY